MAMTIRKLAPAFVVMTLALAGCKTVPTKSTPAAQAPATQQGSANAPSNAPANTQQPVSVSPVEFYIAQTEAGDNLTKITLPDGALYIQQQPVLTRADLTESAALVDKKGQNFVGLRFSPDGARKLTDISTSNVGKILALVVDRQLVAAPRISEPLNRGVLAFAVPTAQDANDLALRIRGQGAAGAAPGNDAPPPPPMTH
jgi:preprotein translocase subunit SecD